MKKLKGFSLKKKKNKCKKLDRMLIIINVVGSCGPIRLVVSKDENAGKVIHAALKLYARHGRLPLLESDVNSYSLYPQYHDHHHGD